MAAAQQRVQASQRLQQWSWQPQAAPGQDAAELARQRAEVETMADGSEWEQLVEVDCTSENRYCSLYGVKHMQF